MTTTAFATRTGQEMALKTNGADGTSPDLGNGGSTDLRDVTQARTTVGIGDRGGAGGDGTGYGRDDGPSRDPSRLSVTINLDPRASKFATTDTGAPIPLTQMRAVYYENMIVRDLQQNVFDGAQDFSIKNEPAPINDDGMATALRIQYTKLDHIMTLSCDRPAEGDISRVVNLAYLARLIHENPEFGGLKILNDRLVKLGGDVQVSAASRPAEQERIAAGLSADKFSEIELLERRVARYREYQGWLNPSEK